MGAVATSYISLPADTGGGVGWGGGFWSSILCPGPSRHRTGFCLPAMCDSAGTPAAPRAVERVALLSSRSLGNCAGGVLR